MKINFEKTGSGNRKYKQIWCFDVNKQKSQPFLERCVQIL